MPYPLGRHEGSIPQNFFEGRSIFSEVVASVTDRPCLVSLPLSFLLAKPLAILEARPMPPISIRKDRKWSARPILLQIGVLHPPRSSLRRESATHDLNHFPGHTTTRKKVFFAVIFCALNYRVQYEEQIRWAVNPAQTEHARFSC